MSSRTGKEQVRSAAWRISLWATLAYTCGTVIVFIVLDRFVAKDIQRRTDAWLSGEVEVLSDVAEHTPNDALYNRVVGEVAELASREVPNRTAASGDAGSAVFFLMTGSDGAMKLWVGAGSGETNLQAIRSRRVLLDRPSDIRIQGFSVPFRVASVAMDGGGRVYLGVSERDEMRVLRNLRLRFFLLWLSLVLLGFLVVFFSSRRTLSHVRRITEAASRIGHSDLKARVPTSERHDEMADLALTLNRMLDRIEQSVLQLHTITDSLAHDLRSPLTAMRGKLETSLGSLRDGEQAEAVVAAIEELDRLTEFLNKSLDVAEAKADALFLRVESIDLDELLRAMIGLYEPSMSEKGLKIELQSQGPVRIEADPGLIHRMIANLFDNELKHLGPGYTVTVVLREKEDCTFLIVRDNGAGFDPDVFPHLFSMRVKGRHSGGHGLGLAFVDAVMRAHGGSATASEAEGGGAEITLTMPNQSVGSGLADKAAIGIVQA
jgi:signal transduction histidine kinase